MLIVIYAYKAIMSKIILVFNMKTVCNAKNVVFLIQAKIKHRCALNARGPLI